MSLIHCFHLLGKRRKRLLGIEPLLMQFQQGSVGKIIQYQYPPILLPFQVLLASYEEGFDYNQLFFG